MLRSNGNNNAHNLVILKMLGLYLYTLIIDHKSCNMLSILKKLTLQKGLQNFCDKNVLFDKKKIHNNNKTNNQT